MTFCRNPFQRWRGEWERSSERERKRCRLVLIPYELSRSESLSERFCWESALLLWATPSGGVCGLGFRRFGEEDVIDGAPWVMILCYDGQPWMWINESKRWETKRLEKQAEGLFFQNGFESNGRISEILNNYSWTKMPLLGWSVATSSSL